MIRLPSMPQFRNDPNNTKVLYQCTCGRQIELAESEGGVCPQCDQVISPKLLHHNLAMSMTISTPPDSVDTDDAGTLYFEDQQTASGGSEGEQSVIESEMKGRTFGHFKIVDSLGQGGMGQVFRALDTSLKRYVAVKVLRSGLSASTNARSSDFEIEQLMQEAIAQARVIHPNITTIYYVGKEDETPFLAMELIYGQSIAEKIAEGPMVYSEIHSIASQLAGVLRFSHELDIIHGDIKPSNIMVQSNGIAKLSDFGLARRASKKQSSPFGGTPNYLAPELLEGERSSIQSDMYALGVTLFEMTFGRLPVSVSGASMKEWIASHEQHPVSFPTPWPEHLAAGWRTFLQRLLSRDPATRFDSWKDVVEDLEKIQPAPTLLAKRVPRIVATLIDVFLVLLLQSPMEIMVQVPLIRSWLDEHTLTYATLRVVVEFGAIIAFTLLVMVWKQSPGRRLMQVRVVNKHGLNVVGRKMVARSVLRMFIIWASTFGLIYGTHSPQLTQTGFMVGILFTVLNFAFLLFRSDRKSLHDKVFSTSVVIDTD